MACATALGLLAAVVFGSDAVQRADSGLLEAVMAPSGDAAGTGVHAVADLAGPAAVVPLLVLACGIALWRRRTLDAAAAIVVVAGANLSTMLLKHLFAAARIQPAFVNHELLPTAIFPSGHATAAASVAIAFALVVPRSSLPLTAAIGALYVAAVDAAILILAWHYPSDVVAGTLVACGWGLAVLAARRSLEARAASLRPPAPSPSPRSSPAPPGSPASPGWRRSRPASPSESA
jgi:membrane-associated phospholipid phosphatase